MQSKWMGWPRASPGPSTFSTQRGSGWPAVANHPLIRFHSSKTALTEQG